MRTPAWAALVLTISIAIPVGGCGTEDPAGDMDTVEQGGDGEETSQQYRVVLGNALSDTLRGSAGFGTVTEPASNEQRFVIRLSTGFDFAGGIIIARRNASLPEEGTYDLHPPVDTLAAAETGQFTLFYREGMLRNLQATDGSLTLSTVTDTLIVGSFDATLRGNIANLSRGGGPVDVHAVGRFRARRDLQGYVIGL